MGVDVLDLRRIKELLLRGYPIMIHDSSGREDEVDMVIYAPAVGAEHISLLRTVAGGLICYVMPLSIGRELGLKYMDEILRECGFTELTKRRLGYGDPPNFSLWVNHVGAKTGIRDEDRALTIRELDRVVELVIKGDVASARRKFYSEFISPGHVPILLGRGLKVRRGHTELSIALAELVGLRPSLVIAEMLSDYGAMSVDEARNVANYLGTLVLEGEEIIRTYEGLNQ